MPFFIVFPLTWRDCVQKEVVNRQQILLIPRPSWLKYNECAACLRYTPFVEWNRHGTTILSSKTWSSKDRYLTIILSTKVGIHKRPSSWLKVNTTENCTDFKGDSQGGGGSKKILLSVALIDDRTTAGSLKGLFYLCSSFCLALIARQKVYVKVIDRGINVKYLTLS